MNDFEKLSPEEENAKNIIESLKDTEAGEKMENEQPKPTKEQQKERDIENIPAEKESINEFYNSVREYSAEGFEEKSTGVILKSFKLSDGRSVSMWCVEDWDESREEPIATLLVNETTDNGGGVRTSYFLYADKRMEKTVDIKTPEELKELSRVRPSPEAATELENKKERKKRVAEEERALGLRRATEGDAQEALGIFQAIEEGRE